VERYSKHLMAKLILEAHRRSSRGTGCRSPLAKPAPPPRYSAAPASAIRRISLTVGLAIGHQSEMTTTSFPFHAACVGLRFRVPWVAWRSVSRMFTAFGCLLRAVGGAVFQKVIALAVVLNAQRAAVSGGELSDD
jgi:hypothetical protein